MNQNQSNEQSFFKIFHPTPDGCVIRDLRFARVMEELYIDELTAIAAASYRAMVCDSCDRALAELLREQMQDEISHFRFLGELILALGGNPVIRSQIRVDPICRADDPRSSCESQVDAVLNAALQDKKRSVDRYQSALGRTQDRVVRSLLLQLIDEEQRHAERLLARKKDCE